MIKNLDLQTRTDLYSFTIKLIRKYHKGSAVGKISSNQLAENIISNDNIGDIIDSHLLTQPHFRNSYISYIDKLLKENEQSLNSSTKKRYAAVEVKKPSIPQQVRLKSLLETSSYSLNIPIQYLNEKEVNGLIEYLTTGQIELGNEKIYNFISAASKKA